MIELEFDVGYMNAHHQRIIAHGQTRFSQHPVLVARCALCGHQYGASDNRFIAQRCPRHDREFEGQAAEAGDVEWLEH